MAQAGLGWYNPSSSSLPASAGNHAIDLYFMNADSGLVITKYYGPNSDVLITTDGGQTWAHDTVLPSLNCIYADNYGLYLGGDNGVLYKATISASGLNYTSLTSGTTSDIYDIYFTSATDGYLVGEGGLIRKTTNGGTSWTSPVVSGLYHDFNAVHFTTPSTGYVVGTMNIFQGFIAKTVSGGQVFGTLTPTISVMQDIHFPTQNVGYAVGKGGLVYKTTDGTNFNLVSSGTTDHINAVYFLNADTGFIVGSNGLIKKTLDGGSNWIDQSFFYPVKTNAISVLDYNLAYIAVDTAAVLKTTTSGTSLIVSTVDDSIYCNTYTNIQLNTTYNGTDSLTYSWAANPLLDSLNSPSPLAGPLSQTETFYVSVSDGTITVNDSVTIHVIPMPADSICIVTVDDSIGHNLVIFEKQQVGPIHHYNIYRETSVANIYDSIGFIPADSFGYFIDTASNPAVRAYRYKISTVDSCGNESILSDHHKTMHLTVNQGTGSSWNLIWTHYEGIPVNTYRIWRADTSGNFALIDSVSGTNTSYSDLNPPIGGLFYQVEIITSYTCQPFNYKANTNYNSSRSNQADNGLINPTPLSSDFTADVTSGNYPLTVNFSDLTAGNPDNWVWHFGDGDTSHTQNPTHTYTSKGLYTVKLVVSNMSGYDSIIKVDYINAHNVAIDDINNIQFSIYPNPVNNESNLYIEADDINNYELFLSDIIGNTLKAKIIQQDNKRVIIKTNKLSSGVYLIKLKSLKTNTVFLKKFIVE